MSAIDPNTSAYALAVQWAVLLDLEGLSVLNDAKTHVNIDDVTETEAGVFVETDELILRKDQNGARRWFIKTAD